METLLPRVMVGKHEYEVDMLAGELRSVKDKSKALEFFKMDVEGDKLAFWYNHETQKIVGAPSPQDQQHIQRVSFPLQSLDPAFSKKIAAEAEEAEALIRAGKSIYSNPEGIHAQIPIEGNSPQLLPVINLYGTEFFLDLRLKEFRQVDNFNNKIQWHALDQDALHFMLWYNTTTKNAFTGTFEQARQREDVKALVLPPLDLMIRDGVKRHMEKINRACEFIETAMDKELAKGDDEFYESTLPYRAETRRNSSKGKMNDAEPAKRKQRKGKGL